MALVALDQSEESLIDSMRNSRGGFSRMMGEQEAQDQVDPDAAIFVECCTLIKRMKKILYQKVILFYWLTLQNYIQLLCKRRLGVGLLRQSTHSDFGTLINSIIRIINVLNLNKSQTMNNYSIEKIIGQGAFGNAYLAVHTKSNEEYVIKKIDLKGKSKDEKEQIYNEVKLLQEFKHVSIVSYRESFIDSDGCLNIIMEYCQGGDINQLIENNIGKKFQEKQIIDWAVQIALAIFYMHDKRILHRDLKTPNIFLNNAKVKLGDFGISKVLDQTVDLASTNIGTPYYMSPEQYKHKPYSYKSDIWAFGCILYEICNHKRPFEGLSLNGLAVKILEGKFAPVSEFYTSQLRELISKMLSKNAKDRPTILQFLQKPFIKRRTATYLRQVYQNLLKETVQNKQLIEGVIYQASKLLISLQEPEKRLTTEPNQRKTKAQFSAEKKKQETEKAKQHLDQKLKKIEEERRVQFQKLKKLEESRKAILNRNLSKNTNSQHSFRQNSKKQFEKPGKESSRSIAESIQKSATTENTKNEVEDKRPFKMEEDYDMYEMDYEEEEEDNEKEENIIQEENEEAEDLQKVEVARGYNKDKYANNSISKKQTKPRAVESSHQSTGKLEKTVEVNQVQPVIEQKVIEDEVSVLKQSIKIKNEEIYTIRNELSNVDFQISSSDSDSQEGKGEEQGERMKNESNVQMKKKVKNPLHARLIEKINELEQKVDLVIKKDVYERLLGLIKNSDREVKRTQIQKIAGTERVGVFHLVNEIQKIRNLVQKVPAYLS